MKLSTTSIKHKRYSTYGWNVIENGMYKNTLSQGEIGVLLGHEYTEINDSGEEIVKVDPVTTANSGNELNCVLEVRIGTKDNQYFFQAMVINTRENIDYSVRIYDNYNQLPSFGNSSALYIVKGSNTIYIWDDSTTTGTWKPLITGSNIEGGFCDLSSYYTKKEIDFILENWVMEMIDGGNAIREKSSVVI